MSELTTQRAATSVVADKVADLVSRVAAQMETAKTAAEFLDIIDMAKIKAGEASGLARMHSAHKEVVDICHKATGDLLLIERAAQCRIAEEYDKAQERGEIAKPGGSGGNRYTKSRNVPDQNISKVDDLGLTRKLVHEARKIRDAEKEKPGEARKAIEEMVKTGKEPTRASVRRAMKDEPSTVKKRGKERLKPHYKRDEIISLHDQGVTDKKIAEQVGMSYRVVRDVVEREKNERNAKADGKAEAEVQVPLDALSMSAQEKAAAWRRQEEKRLREEISLEERKKVHQSWNETVLPHYKKKLEDAERVVKSRKGVWTRAFFRKLLACVHPDRSVGVEMLQEVFSEVKDSELVVCREAEAPTVSLNIPQTVDELLARKSQTNGASHR